MRSSPTTLMSQISPSSQFPLSTTIPQQQQGSSNNHLVSSKTQLACPPPSPPFHGTNIFTLSALGVNSFLEWFSLDISIYIRLARSNLLRALPRKPVTIFGQLDPARLPKKPPGDARAPPRPPDEVAGYPAVPPPPLFGRLPQIDACRSHVCVVFTHL